MKPRLPILWVGAGLFFTGMLFLAASSHGLWRALILALAVLAMIVTLATEYERQVWQGLYFEIRDVADEQNVFLKNFTIKDMGDDAVELAAIQAMTGELLRRSEKALQKAEATSRGMTERRLWRAKLFRSLKDEHPDWSYERVATESLAEAERLVRQEKPGLDDELVYQMALEKLGGKPPTGDTVRNDYSKMRKMGKAGWDWPRANRIR